MGYNYHVFNQLYIDRSLLDSFFFFGAKDFISVKPVIVKINCDVIAVRCIGGDVKYDSNKLTKKKILEIPFHFDCILIFDVAYVYLQKFPFLPKEGMF